MPASIGNFLGNSSYSFQDRQEVALSAHNKPFSHCICYKCEELGHMRRDCPHPRVLDFAQQLSRVVVPHGMVITVEGVNKVGNEVIREVVK